MSGEQEVDVALPTTERAAELFGRSLGQRLHRYVYTTNVDTAQRRFGCFCGVGGDADSSGEHVEKAAQKIGREAVLTMPKGQGEWTIFLIKFAANK